MIQGAYIQWLVEQHPEALNIKSIHIISRHTLGYRKRYAYIKAEDFKGMEKSKRSRDFKKLKNLGLLEYKKTRGYTMFKLVLPKELEDIVLWRYSDSKENKEKDNGKNVQVELEKSPW
jgi:hypothetical protein